MKTIITKYDGESETIVKVILVTEEEFKKLKKEKNQPPLSLLKTEKYGDVYTYYCVENNRIVF